MKAASILRRLQSIVLSKAAIVLWILLVSALALLGVRALRAAPPRALRNMAAPASQILCVDDNGGPTGGAPCSNSTAFTLIQDAVNIASIGGGDEIRVA